MKRILFPIIAVLLVMGLVLPGCAGEGGPPEEEGVVYTFEDGEIVIGIAGEVGHATGDMQWAAAQIAAGAINGADGVDIDGTSHTIVLQRIDTKEASDETGEQGTIAMSAAIDDVDFVMGGFRTESTEVYREVAMDAQKLFFNCGAATEALQHSAVTDYDKYKYWFKTTPYNEHFLAQSVLRILDAVAIKLRQELGLAPDAELTAAIISEDLKWASDEQVPEYEAGLPALNIKLLDTYLVDSLAPASTMGALTDIQAKYDPHFIIPVYSGTMGVAYAQGMRAYVPNAMSVGINVYAQLKAPWAADLATAPPGGPACAYQIQLDTWAEGPKQSAMTADFLNAFASVVGEYPLYTAATYDAIFGLKAALEDVGYMEDGVGKAKANDLIQWYEDPANAQPLTSGKKAGTYPQPGTTVDGKPALSEDQVAALYPGTEYNAADWVMPPHPTHDLIYGPEWVTGVGAQWQWDEAAGVWKKVGIWPMEIEGVDLVDQYGDWNFQYPGTKPLVIPQNVIDHFG